MGGNKEPSLKRRTWLGLGIGTLVAAAAGATVRFGLPDKKERQQGKAKGQELTGTLIEALQDNFDYIQLLEEDAKTYVRDYLAANGSKRVRRKSGLPEDFFTTFLLSTDFFVRGAKTGTQVKYLSFYDPEKLPCQHPFAKFD